MPEPQQIPASASPHQGPARVNVKEAFSRSRTAPERRGRVRDAARTKARVLKAAAHEFGSKGLDGARLDAIADRAQVSRELILYHFKTKRGLYEAVLEQLLGREFAEADVRAEDPTKRLVALYRLSVLDSELIRLQLWEGLAFRPGSAISPDVRKRHFREAVELCRRNQAAGLLPDGLEPSFLAAALLALAIFPVALPQLVALSTGRAPTGPKFHADYEQFLRSLGELLKGCSSRGG